MKLGSIWDKKNSLADASEFAIKGARGLALLINHAVCVCVPVLNPTSLVHRSVLSAR